MKRIIVIITALLSIGIGSCSNNNSNNNICFQDIQVTEFEYDNRTYIIFEKGFYKMGVVEKHETDGCDNIKK